MLGKDGATALREGVKTMEKYRILCFGDSLTWGFHPETRERIGPEARWTGVLQSLLGDEYAVIEEGQNGRTIATDDPAEGEKNGLKYIVPCLESHNPLDVLILMLGTNDLKRKFSYCAKDIGGELQIFLEKVRSFERWHMTKPLKVLVMAPPVVGAVGAGSWLEDLFDFQNCCRVSTEAPQWYAEAAEIFGCAFLDTSKIVEVSPADGVHLTPEDQTKLGRAVCEKLRAEGFLK